MNILAAWLIFTIGFRRGVTPIQIIPDNFIAGSSESLLMPTYQYLQSQGFISGSVVTGDVTVLEVLPGQLADQAGIMSGDIITEIDSVDVNNQNLSTMLKEKLGQTITITYNRNRQLERTTIDCPMESCVLGIFMANDSTQQILPIKYPLGKAMAVA